MAPKPAPDKRESIISIDPVIASHITTTSLDAAPGKHLRTESTPYKRSKALDTFAAQGHARAHSTPHQDKHTHANSLRRTKDSTEVLKQHNAKTHQKKPTLESIGDTRGGRTFTVGNVGTGGVLYLRLVMLLTSDRITLIILCSDHRINNLHLHLLPARCLQELLLLRSDLLG